MNTLFFKASIHVELDLLKVSHSFQQWYSVFLFYVHIFRKLYWNPDERARHFQHFLFRASKLLRFLSVTLGTQLPQFCWRYIMRCHGSQTLFLISHWFLLFLRNSIPLGLYWTTFHWLNRMLGLPCWFRG